MLVFNALTFSKISAQCEVFDGEGVLSSTPVWLSCFGTNYTLNFQSTSSFGDYTIDWGDGSSIESGTSFVPPQVLTHIYPVTVGSYTVTFTDINSTCQIIGTVIMEEPTTASIQIPFGGVTQTCAPSPIEFINSSTNVSPTTIFTWDFGDGSAPLIVDFNNLGDTVIHQYLQGTVNCETQVSLTAENQCNIAQGGSSTATFNPIRIWDLDDASISASDVLLCYPEVQVAFTNTTNRNCLTQGNTFQRQEYWNFGDYWGLGYDSIIDWTPWPPAFPNIIDYPGIGIYSVMMIDSNFCGQDTAFIEIQIVPPPTAGFILSNDTACVDQTISVNDVSAGGANIISWNFGDGSGWLSANGNASHTYISAGTYTIQQAVSIGGSSGCTDTISMEIVILPVPNANFVLDNNLGCDNVSVNFTDASTNAINWLWNFGNGNTFNGISPGTQVYSTVGTYNVSLTVTALNGCTDNRIKPVTVYASPTVDFAPQSVCENSIALFNDQSTSSAGDPIVSWNWDFGNGNSSNLQNPSNTYLSNGNYDVILEVATANCSSIDTMMVIVEPIPVASFTQDVFEGCPILNVNFNNTSSGAAGYEWDFGDGLTSTNANPSHGFNNLSSSDVTYNVALIASTLFGCKDTAYGSVDVYYGVNADFSHNGFPGCAPLNVNFTNLSTTGQSYEWNFGDGTSDVAFHTDHQYINSTLFINSYLVELIVNSFHGCSDTTSQYITVYPLPDFSFTSVPDSGCSPLLVNFPTVVGAVTYEWDFGDGNSVIGVSPSHLYSNSTTNDVSYVVQLIATSPFGCKDTNYGEVKVFPNPIAQFTISDNEGCAPFSVSFQNNSIGSTDFIWNYDDGNISDTSAAIHEYLFNNSTSNDIIFSTSLIATTNNGCIDTALGSVTVHPQVTADFVVDTVGCEPLNSFFNNQSLNANQFLWNFNNGNVSTSQNPTEVFTNPTSMDMIYHVQLIASSSSNCMDTSYQDILVFPAPIAQFNVGNSSGCGPFSADFVNNSIDAANYFWDFDDGNTSSNSNLNFSHQYQNTGSSTTVYNPSLIVGTTNGCFDTTDIFITVFPQVFAAFSVDTAGCTPYHAFFTDLSSNADNWVWDYNNGFVDTQQNPNEYFFNNTNSDSIYLVQLIASSSNFCSDTAYQQILVHPVPNALFTPTPITQTYPSTSVSINNASSTGSWNYAWDFGDGSTDSGFTPITHNYNTWGDFVIQLIVSSPSCSDTSERTITIIPPLPDPHFYGSGEGCRPVTIQFYDSSQYTDSYYWDFGDGGFSTLPNPYYTYHQAGDYNISVTLTGPGGVVNYLIEDSVHVYEYAVAFFQHTPTEIYAPTEPVQFYNLSSYANQYTWYFGDGNFSNQSNPEYFYSSEGVYDVTLIANNDNNCPDTITVPQAVIAQSGGEIAFPNAFTPNTSGPSGGIYNPSAVDNDIFFPLFEGVEEYHLSIFNRWGELIFESKDINIGWDGYYRDQLCQQDVYIWKAKVKFTNGKEEVYLGELHLIR
ncbi:MAG: PKD domain-containing protein [Flavobacteriales bacterium]|nr:PKD domain-containing protein [Flavobacteriales bacterium]